jgi:NADP-dependent aldehyde dehydrogenase
MLADRLASGQFTAVTVDPADPNWPPAPRPDLRRTHVPIGPVLVFAASNFPFAFSVAGGDSMSALAAGCPVVVKANPGHPELSRQTADLVVASLTRAGAPDGVFALIDGEQAGVAATKDRRIKAVAFTGSTRGGRALFDLASARPDPIPFYGELGSTNPVVVTPSGWATRADEIASGFAASLTVGSGQFCTKPGVVFVPDVDAFVARVPLLAAGPLLNPHITRGYLTSVEQMAKLASPVRGTVPTDTPSPVLFRSTSAEVRCRPELLDLEMFGPAALVVEYAGMADLLEMVEALPGQLTATVHGGHEIQPDEISLLSRLAEHAGRVIWNDWPTGVAVTDAQHHGGPYPASTSPLSTSVGTAAVWRFLRPVTFQNLPPTALAGDLQRFSHPPTPEGTR